MALLSSQDIKDGKLENAIFKRRLLVIIFFVFVFFTVVLSRVYYLQTVRYSDFLSLAADNHIRLRSIPPERGLIYDSKDKLLASNIQSNSLFVHPLKVEDIDALLEVLSELIDLDAEQIDRFMEEYSISHRRTELIALKERLTEKEIARLMANKHRLLGMEVQPQYQRLYPYGDLVSHIIGYIGRISPEEERVINREDYQALNMIGKLGVEKFYENELRGEAGIEEVGVNVYGDVVKTYAQEDPHKGNDIKLWLDVDLQKFVSDTLGEHQGAAVVLDARTGGVLAMVSKPSYDNNRFVDGISQTEFDLIRHRPDAPLLNRATAGAYSPGSTIKPFYAMVALDNGIVTPDYIYIDTGKFKLKNSPIVFRNWKRSGHGEVNLLRALRVSSDTYFYNLATLMGYEQMYQGLLQFGFGKASALDVYGEQDMVLPTDRWKRNKHHLPWFPGDTVNMGIGQGYLLVTPTQLAAATLVLINRGSDIRPQLAQFVNNRPQLQPGLDEYRLHAMDVHWDLVFQGLEEVVHHEEGTARRASRGISYTMAGKTGTTQVVSLDRIAEAQRQGEEIKKEWLDHALFVGYAPSRDPRYVISLVLEHGGSGSNAAVMARAVFDYLIIPRTDLSTSN